MSKKQSNPPPPRAKKPAPPPAPPSNLLKRTEIAKYHDAAKMIELDGVEGYFTCCERFGRDIATATLVTWLRSRTNQNDEWPTENLTNAVNDLLTESGRLAVMDCHLRLHIGPLPKWYNQETFQRGNWPVWFEQWFILNTHGPWRADDYDPSRHPTGVGSHLSTAWQAFNLGDCDG